MTAFTKFLAHTGLALTLLGPESPVSAQDAVMAKDGGGDGKDYIIIEGDIQIPVKYKDNIIAATWDTKFWTNGTVPFEFDANVTSANQQRMLDAMAEWERAVTIDFVARTNEQDYIHIQDASTNDSRVGMQGGQQIMNIFNWNRRFIMAHELGHALGYWHEQSRPDRDNYIRIETANIQTDAARNFDKHDAAGYYGPYDFDSVMHYGQCDFSIDCPVGSTCSCTHSTITVLTDTTWQTRIGQRNHLSRMDTLTMSFIYPESNWRFVDGKRGGLPFSGSGSFFDPFRVFSLAASLTPEGGTIWVQPDSYSYTGTLTKRMSIKAPLGDVTIGRSSTALNANNQNINPAKEVGK